MELPDLGKHCSEKSCRQLDFLPMKCDACSLIFCKDHLQYDKHNCTGLYKKNIQVPVCPLCSQPVPVSRGSVPDHAVSQHIENNCETRKKAKVFSNKCNKAKCKKKELVPLICDVCKLNFCLTHRHPADHDCQGPPDNRGRAAAAASARASSQTSSSSSGQSKISEFFSGPFRQPQAASSGGGQSRGQLSASAAAALNRQQGRGVTPGRPLVARSANGDMSEDEALAAALAASLGSGGSQEAGGQGPRSASEEEEDRMLALALAESERMEAESQRQRQGTTTGGDKSCSMQ